MNFLSRRKPSVTNNFDANTQGWQLKNRNYFLLAIFAGAMLALSFPPLPFFMLSFAAFVPVLVIINDRPRKFFLMLFIVFFLFHGGANWWISSWRSETDPFLLVSGLGMDLAHPFFFLVPCYVQRFLVKRHGKQALWLFPFVFLAFEWLHSLGELAYPWLTIGYTQIYNRYWVQAADISGVWGISFLILLFNVLLYFMIDELRSAQQETNSGRNSKHILSTIFRNQRIRNYSIALLIILILPNIYGIIRIGDFNHEELLKNNETLKIGLIQPNIDPWAKWDTDNYAQILRHKKMQDSLITAVGPLDLCLWSETAVTYLNLNVNYRHEIPFIQNWLDTSGTSLFTGFADFHIYPRGAKTPVTAKYFRDSTQMYDAFNSALLLNPKPHDSLNPQIYHKINLTPFGERLPYASIFSFAKSWFEWSVGISSWGVGKEQKNLTLVNHGKTVEVGPIICIESIYPGFVNNYTKMGAGVLAIITNDGWYDYTEGPEQHYQIACMRAIENRRYIARCANTGVSGFITPTGTSLVRLPEYTSAGLSATIPVLKGESIYTRIGDVLPVGAFLISLLTLVLGWVKKVGGK